MILQPKVEITFSHELSDYEMRRLAEAIALCDRSAEVKLNDQQVSLDDMLMERNTWDTAWSRFDADKNQQFPGDIVEDGSTYVNGD